LFRQKKEALKIILHETFCIINYAKYAFDVSLPYQDEESLHRFYNGWVRLEFDIAGGKEAEGV